MASKRPPQVRLCGFLTARLGQTPKKPRREYLFHRRSHRQIVPIMRDHAAIVGNHAAIMRDLVRYAAYILDERAGRQRTQIVCNKRLTLKLRDELSPVMWIGRHGSTLREGARADDLRMMPVRRKLVKRRSARSHGSRDRARRMCAAEIQNIPPHRNREYLSPHRTSPFCSLLFCSVVTLLSASSVTKA